jgi:hypothetical protein
MEVERPKPAVEPEPGRRFAFGRLAAWAFFALVAAVGGVPLAIYEWLVAGLLVILLVGWPLLFAARWLLPRSE